MQGRTSERDQDVCCEHLCKRVPPLSRAGGVAPNNGYYYIQSTSSLAAMTTSVLTWKYIPCPRMG